MSRRRWLQLVGGGGIAASVTAGTAAAAKFTYNPTTGRYEARKPGFYRVPLTMNAPIEIKADGVTIDGQQGGVRSTISTNAVSGAIRCTGQKDLAIQNLQIVSPTGISARRVDGLEINTVRVVARKESRDGIYVRECADVEMVRCFVHNALRGFRVMANKGEVSIDTCHATSDSADGPADVGFALSRARDVTLESCLARQMHDYGFRTYKSREIHIKSCLSTENQLDGFRFNDLRGGVIENCFAISNGSRGFIVWPGRSVTFRHCLSYGNRTGFDVARRSNLIVFYCCRAGINDASGFRFAGPVKRCIWQYCHSYANTGFGYKSLRGNAGGRAEYCSYRGNGTDLGIVDDTDDSRIDLPNTVCPGVRELSEGEVALLEKKGITLDGDSESETEVEAEEKGQTETESPPTETGGEPTETETTTPAETSTPTPTETQTETPTETEPTPTPTETETETETEASF